MTTNVSSTSDAVLQAVQQTILELDDSLQSRREQEEWTIQDACEIYEILSNFKSQIGVLIRDHENYLVEFMSKSDTEAVVLESGLAVTKEYSKNRKAWKHKDLAHVVASRIENLAYDIDTGERLLTTQEMISKLLDYVQPSYWRITSLSEIGISADDYCETGDTEAKIRLGKVK
jgi:hypothetical protein